jgi:hypothetical protein
MIYLIYMHNMEINIDFTLKYKFALVYRIILMHMSDNKVISRSRFFYTSSNRKIEYSRNFLNREIEYP